MCIMYKVFNKVFKIVVSFFIFQLLTFWYSFQANCFALEDNVLNIFWLMKILEAQEQTVSLSIFGYLSWVEFRLSGFMQ